MDILINQFHKFKMKFANRHKNKIKMRGRSSRKNFWPFILRLSRGDNREVIARSFDKPTNTMEYVWSGEAIESFRNNVATIRPSGGRLSCVAIQTNANGEEYQHNESVMFINVPIIIINDEQFILKNGDQYLLNMRVTNVRGNSWNITDISIEDGTNISNSNNKRQIFVTFDDSISFGNKSVNISVEDGDGFVGTITRSIFYTDASQFENFTLDLLSNPYRLITAINSQTLSEFSSVSNTITYSWSGSGLLWFDINNANVKKSGGEIICTATQRNTTTRETITQTVSILINTPTIIITDSDFVSNPDQSDEYMIGMTVDNINGLTWTLDTQKSAITDGTGIRSADDKLFITFDASVETGIKEVVVVVNDEYGYENTSTVYVTYTNTNFEPYTLTLTASQRKEIIASTLISDTDTVTYVWTGDVASSGNNIAVLPITGGTAICTASQSNGSVAISHSQTITITQPTITITDTDFAPNPNQSDEYMIDMTVSNMNGSTWILHTNSTVTDGTSLRFSFGKLYITFGPSVQTGIKIVNVTVEDAYGYQNTTTVNVTYTANTIDNVSEFEPYTLILSTGITGNEIIASTLLSETNTITYNWTGEVISFDGNIAVLPNTGGTATCSARQSNGLTTREIAPVSIIINPPQFTLGDDFLDSSGERLMYVSYNVNSYNGSIWDVTVPTIPPGLTFTNYLNDVIYFQYEGALENGNKTIEITITDEYGYISSITKDILFNKIEIVPATWDETNSYPTLFNDNEHKLVLAWNVNEWGWDDPIKISIDIVNLGSIDMKDTDGNYDINATTYDLFNERTVTSIPADSSLFDVTWLQKFTFDLSSNEISSTRISHALTKDSYNLPLLVECELKFTNNRNDTTILMGNVLKENNFIFYDNSTDYIIWGTGLAKKNYALAVNGTKIAIGEDKTRAIYTKFSIYVSSEIIIMYQNDVEKYRFTKENYSFPSWVVSGGTVRVGVWQRNVGKYKNFKVTEINNPLNINTGEIILAEDVQYELVINKMYGVDNTVLSSSSLYLTTELLPVEPTLTVSSIWDGSIGSLFLNHVTPRNVQQVNVYYKLTLDADAVYQLWSGDLNVITNLNGGESYDVKVEYQYQFRDHIESIVKSSEILNTTIITNQIEPAIWDTINSRSFITADGNNGIELYWYVNSWGNKTPHSLSPISIQITGGKNQTIALNDSTISTYVISENLNDNTSYNFQISKRYGSNKYERSVILALTTLELPTKPLLEVSTIWDGGNSDTGNPVGSLLLEYDNSSSDILDTKVFYKLSSDPDTNYALWEGNQNMITGLLDTTYDVKISYEYLYNEQQLIRFSDVSSATIVTNWTSAKWDTINSRSILSAADKTNAVELHWYVSGWGNSTPNTTTPLQILVYDRDSRKPNNVINIINISSLTQTTTVISNLNNNTNYAFKIRKNRTSGNPINSSDISLRTLDLPSNPVLSLSHNWYGNDGDIVLTYDVSSPNINRVYIDYKLLNETSYIPWDYANNGNTIPNLAEGEYVIQLTYEYIFNGVVLLRYTIENITVKSLFEDATWNELNTRTILNNGDSAFSLHWATNKWGWGNTPVKIGFLVKIKDGSSVGTVILKSEDGSNDLDSTSYTLTDVNDTNLLNNTTYTIEIIKYYNNTNSSSSSIEMTTFNLPPVPSLSLAYNWYGSNGDIELTYDASSPDIIRVLVNYKLLNEETYIPWDYVSNGNTIPNLEEGEYIVELIYEYTYDGSPLQRRTDRNIQVKSILENAIWNQEDTQTILNNGDSAFSLHWTTNGWGWGNTPVKIGFFVKKGNTKIGTVILQNEDGTNDLDSTSYVLTEVSGNRLLNNSTYTIRIRKWYNTTQTTSSPIELTTFDLPSAPSLTLNSTWNNVDVGDIIMTYDASSSDINNVTINYKLSTDPTYDEWDSQNGNTIPELPAGEYLVQLIYEYTFNNAPLYRQTIESVDIVNVFANATWDNANTETLLYNGDSVFSLYWNVNSWGENNTPKMIDIRTYRNGVEIRPSIFMYDANGNYDVNASSFILSTDGSNNNKLLDNTEYQIEIGKWWNSSNKSTSSRITLTTLDLPPIPTFTYTSTYYGISAGRGSIFLSYDASSANQYVIYLKGPSNSYFVEWTSNDYEISNLDVGTYEIKLKYIYTYEGNPLERTSLIQTVEIEDVLLVPTWNESETKAIITNEGKHAIQLSWLVQSWGPQIPESLQIQVKNSKNKNINNAFVTLNSDDNFYVIDDLHNINENNSILLNNNTEYRFRIRKNYTGNSNYSSWITKDTLDYPEPVITSITRTWDGSVGNLTVNYNAVSSGSTSTVFYKIDGETNWNQNLGDIIRGLEEGNYDIRVVFTHIYEGITFERVTESTAVISKFVDYEPVLTSIVGRTINVDTFSSDISTIKYTWRRVDSNGTLIETLYTESDVTSIVMPENGGILQCESIQTSIFDTSATNIITTSITVEPPVIILTRDSSTGIESELRVRQTSSGATFAVHTSSYKVGRSNYNSTGWSNHGNLNKSTNVNEITDGTIDGINDKWGNITMNADAVSGAKTITMSITDNRGYKTEISVEVQYTAQVFDAYSLVLSSGLNRLITANELLDGSTNTLTYLWTGDIEQQSVTNTATANINGGNITCTATQQNELGFRVSHTTDISITAPVITVPNAIISADVNGLYVTIAVSNSNGSTGSPTWNLVSSSISEGTYDTIIGNNVYFEIGVDITSGNKTMIITIEDEYGYQNSAEFSISYTASSYEPYELDFDLGILSVTATSFTDTATNTMSYSWSGSAFDSNITNIATTLSSGGDITCIATQTHVLTNRTRVYDKTITISVPTFDLVNTSIGYDETISKYYLDIENIIYNGSTINLTSGTLTNATNLILDTTNNRVTFSIANNVSDGTKSLTLNVEDALGYVNTITNASIELSRAVQPASDDGSYLYLILENSYSNTYKLKWNINSWGISAVPTSIEVWYRLGSNNWTKTIFTDLSTTEFIVENMREDKLYDFKIRKNFVQNGNNGRVDFQINDVRTLFEPKAPTITSLSRTTDINGGIINVVYDEESNTNEQALTEYLISIEYKLDTDTDYTTYTNIPNTTIRNLIENGYDVRVRKSFKIDVYEYTFTSVPSNINVLLHDPYTLSLTSLQERIIQAPILSVGDIGGTVTYLWEINGIQQTNISNEIQIDNTTPLQYPIEVKCTVTQTNLHNLEKNHDEIITIEAPIIDFPSQNLFQIDGRNYVQINVTNSTYSYASSPENVFENGSTWVLERAYIEQIRIDGSYVDLEYETRDFNNIFFVIPNDNTIDNMTIYIEITDDYGYSIDTSVTQRYNIPQFDEYILELSNNSTLITTVEATSFTTIHNNSMRWSWKIDNVMMEENSTNNSIQLVDSVHNNSQVYLTSTVSVTATQTTQYGFTQTYTNTLTVNVSTTSIVSTTIEQLDGQFYIEIEPSSDGLTLSLESLALKNSGNNYVNTTREIDSNNRIFITFSGIVPSQLNAVLIVSNELGYEFVTTSALQYSPPAFDDYSRTFDLSFKTDGLKTIEATQFAPTTTGRTMSYTWSVISGNVTFIQQSTTNSIQIDTYENGGVIKCIATQTNESNFTESYERTISITLPTINITSDRYIYDAIGTTNYNVEYTHTTYSNMLHTISIISTPGITLLSHDDNKIILTFAYNSLNVTAENTLNVIYVITDEYGFSNEQDTEIYYREFNFVSYTLSLTQRTYTTTYQRIIDAIDAITSSSIPDEDADFTLEYSWYIDDETTPNGVRTNFLNITGQYITQVKCEMKQTYFYDENIHVTQEFIVYIPDISDALDSTQINIDYDKKVYIIPSVERNTTILTSWTVAETSLTYKLDNNNVENVSNDTTNTDVTRIYYLLNENAKISQDITIDVIIIDELGFHSNNKTFILTLEIPFIYTWNETIHTNEFRKVYTEAITYVSSNISSVGYTWYIDNIVQTSNTNELQMTEYIDDTVNKNQNRITKIDLEVVLTNNNGFNKHVSLTNSLIIYPSMSFSSLSLVYGYETSVELKQIRYKLENVTMNAGNNSSFEIILGNSVQGFSIPTPGFDSNTILFDILTDVTNGSYDTLIRITNGYGYSAEESINITFERYIPFINYDTPFLTQQADRIIKAREPTISPENPPISWTVVWIVTDEYDNEILNPSSSYSKSKSEDFTLFDNQIQLSDALNNATLMNFKINAQITQINDNNDTLTITQDVPLSITRPTVILQNKGFMNNHSVHIDLDVVSTTEQWNVNSAKLNLNNGEAIYESYTLTNSILIFQLDNDVSWDDINFIVDIRDNYGFVSEENDFNISDLTIEHTPWTPEIVIDKDGSSTTYAKSKNTVPANHTVLYHWTISGSSVSNASTYSIPLYNQNNITIYLDTVLVNQFGFKINKNQQLITIEYPTLLLSVLNLTYESSNIYSLSYNYNIQTLLPNIESITSNDYSISLIYKSSSNINIHSVDKPTKKVLFLLTNLSAGSNVYNITLRITDSFNFSRDYSINVNYSNFPTESDIPTNVLTVGNDRTVSVSVNSYNLSVSYTWIVNNLSGNNIGFTGSGSSIMITNNNNNTIYVQCSITYSDNNNNSVSFVRNTTFNNTFNVYTIGLLIDNNIARVNATIQNQTSYHLEWYWQIYRIDNNSSVESIGWNSNPYLDIPQNFRDSSMYYVKARINEINNYGFANQLESARYDLPTVHISITSFTLLGNRTYKINTNPSNPNVSSTSLQNATQVGHINDLKFQFGEYEQGGGKSCIIVISDSRGFQGSAFKQFDLTVEFTTYDPTIEFLDGKERIVKVADNDNYTVSKLDNPSLFNYTWSASSGITLNSSHSQANRKFKNHVVQESVAGTVYVTVTQISSGFKRDITKQINISTPVFVVNSFEMNSGYFDVSITNLDSTYTNTVILSQSALIQGDGQEYNVIQGTNQLSLNETIDYNIYYLWTKSTNNYGFQRIVYSNYYDIHIVLNNTIRLTLYNENQEEIVRYEYSLPSQRLHDFLDPNVEGSELRNIFKGTLPRNSIYSSDADGLIPPHLVYADNIAPRATQDTSTIYYTLVSSVPWYKPAGYLIFNSFKIGGDYRDYTYIYDGNGTSSTLEATKTLKPFTYTLDSDKFVYINTYKPFTVEMNVYTYDLWYRVVKDYYGYGDDRHNIGFLYHSDPWPGSTGQVYILKKYFQYDRYDDSKIYNIANRLNLPEGNYSVDYDTVKPIIDELMKTYNDYSMEWITNLVASRANWYVGS